MCAHAASPDVYSNEPDETCESLNEGPVRGACLPVIKVQETRPERGQAATVLRPENQPSVRVDSMLSSVPGLGLFRRADSFTAHPTTQGLTMRGVGANAAGRALVTLDGVPLNDPFGGWVYWSVLDPQALEQITVLKGGSAGAYGAQALAGSVAINSKPLEARYRETAMGSGRYSADAVSASVRGAYGSYGSADIGGTIRYAALDGRKALRLSAGYMETDGYHIVSKDQRGPVDVTAASDSAYATFQGYTAVGETISFTPMLRWYREERLNGLALALNATEAVDASFKLARQGDRGADWDVTAYYRHRDFSNVFASAREGRTTEVPVLDQHDVPAWGAGFLARILFNHLELGLDGRRMSGETNEYFRNLGAGFTRERRAGGDQWILGGFMDYRGRFGAWDFAATLRLDRWKTYNGVRLETALDDGSVVRRDSVPQREGWEWSGRLGIERRITGALTFAGAVYKSWRLPTLNEFYRPFRVVNDITEANPNLGTEALYGLDMGVVYQPLPTVKARFTFFRNWLHDGVGNVTIGFGPGFYELGGFVPAGGVLRQRTNIDLSVTDGVELEGELDLQSGFDVAVRYMYARARITDFTAQPELVGLRPVQTPKHVATARIGYDSGARLSGGVEARYSAAQYDDDLNTRKLEAVFMVDAVAAYRLSTQVTVTMQTSNLFDAKVVSALSATGFETIARRRMVRLGFSVAL